MHASTGRGKAFLVTAGSKLAISCTPASVSALFPSQMLDVEHKLVFGKNNAIPGQERIYNITLIPFTYEKCFNFLDCQ